MKLICEVAGCDLAQSMKIAVKFDGAGQLVYIHMCIYMYACMYIIRLFLPNDIFNLLMYMYIYIYAKTRNKFN